MALPAPLPEVLDTDAGAWALSNGRVQPVTDVQRAVLLDAGAQRRQVARTQLATYQDGDMGLALPERRPRWLDPESAPVCVNQDRGAAVQAADVKAIALSGASVATHFAGLRDGSVGVDSGHGFHVVAGNGLRHRAPDAEALATVGAVHVERVPWEIVSLLPEGEELTRDAALTATY